MKLVVDLTTEPDADPEEVADWVLDLLASQDDDAPYTSCDGVDPETP
jgi:hypothetical protein